MSLEWARLDVLGNAPQRAPSLAEQTYAALKQWIVNGDLGPETVVSENDLARRFSISRSPLREAIIRLQDEDLLTASGPRGFRVPALDAELVRQVYGVRAALEGAAAGTARNIPQESIEAMQGRMVAIQEALSRGDAQPFNDSDFEFHDLFISNCGNPLLIQKIERLRGNIQRIINYAGRFAGHTQASFDEHVAILHSISEGDPLAVRAAVESHIEGVTRRLTAHLTS